MAVKFLDRSPLVDKLREFHLDSLAEVIKRLCHQRFQPEFHGMLDTYRHAWSELPNVGADVELKSDAIVVSESGQEARNGEAGKTTSDDDAKRPTSTSNQEHQDDRLESTLMRFHPWRKGPFNIFGVQIDTEWRSNLKWDRLASKIEFAGKRVLDVGCGNGYYGWRMVGQGAKFVLGCEPFLLSIAQFEVLRKYWPDEDLFSVVPLADTDLPRDIAWFDLTLSMGVLYHRPSPIEHLQILASTLRPGGQLVLETLVVESEGCEVLVPEDRYAKMRNVWFIPSVPMLERWLRRVGFQHVQVLDVTPTTFREQRKTDWMTFESLADFLDPADPTRTIEGYPGPVRAIVVARRGR